MIYAILRPDQIDDNWQAAREFLRASFDMYKVQFGGVDDYYSGLKDGSFQLWTATKQGALVGVVVTSIDEGTQAKVCSILSLGGSGLDWMPDLDALIEKFANDNQCTAMQYVGRKGFQKIIPTWEEDGTVFIKRLGVKNG